MRLVLYIFLSFSLQSAAVFAAECHDIVNGRERLACYDSRDQLLASDKAYDVYQLWKAQSASRECDSLEVNPNGYAQYLVATGLKPKDAYNVPNDTFIKGRMDEDLTNIRVDHTAWCQRTLSELSNGEGHYGFALLRQKGAGKP